MKSRIQNQSKALLYHLLKTDKGDKLQHILENHHIKAIELTESMLSATVFDCLNKIDLLSATPLSFEREVIVFHGIEGREMEQILKEMRLAEIDVEMKAVTTKYNLRWKCIDLFHELEKEKEQLDKK